MSASEDVVSAPEAARRRMRRGLRRAWGQRLAFLAKASARLAESLNYEATLQGVAELIVPLLADWCGIDVVAEDGAVEQLAVAHRDPELVAWARELRRRYPLDLTAPWGILEVLSNGRSQLVSHITDAMLQAAARDAAHLELLRKVGFSSLLIVPLVARGQTLGALSLVFAESGRHYTRSDLALAEELARQCALALDRARLYAAERAAQHRTREVLDALLAMAQLLVQAPDEAEDTRSEAGLLGRRLAELTCHVLGCQRASITTYDLVTGASLPLAVAGATPDEEDRWRSGQPGATLREYLDAAHLERLRREELLILDAAEFPERPLPYGVQTLLLALMRVGQHVVGVLALDHGGEAHLYTTEEQALTRAVAKLIGLVIERERLLREREAARAKARALREANRRMEEFLGLASHELRTPLTSIRGSLQIMQRRLDRALDAQDRRDAADVALGRLSPLLDRAIAQTGVLNGLVGDLLDVSLIQAGQLRLQRAPLDLLDLVRQVVEDQRELMPGRAITLERPPLAALTVQADAERLAQVLTNYLDNALKYSAEDQPVSVGVEIEASTARVWVRDAGPGVKVADQRRIWERFHRVEGVGHRFGSSVGLGLGLYISRTIMERHQGQVGVESVPGAGATFWFALPLSR